MAPRKFKRPTGSSAVLTVEKPIPGLGFRKWHLLAVLAVEIVVLTAWQKLTPDVAFTRQEVSGLAFTLLLCWLAVLKSRAIWRGRRFKGR